MQRRKRFVIGGLVIVGALFYIMYGGMQEAMVYFKLPSELKADDGNTRDKLLRMGGMVVKGSLRTDLKNLAYHFELSDGSASIPIFFKGIPPDLFSEGKGAVVEGRMGSDGVIQATTIMAKHAEEYSPHADPKENYPTSLVPVQESAKK